VRHLRPFGRRRRLLLVLLGAGVVGVVVLGISGPARAGAIHASSGHHGAARSSAPATLAATATSPGIQIGPQLPGADSGSGSSSSSSGDTGAQPSCGFLDVSCHIESAIDDWFKDLVTSALNPVLGLLGSTVLATPDVTSGRVGDLWGIGAGIANALVVLLVLAGGALVMGHESLQTRYAAKDVLPRIVVAVIAANASLSLAALLIHVANALSAALLGQGVDPANATDAMRQLVLGPLNGGGIFIVLVGLVVAVLAVVLLATFVIRVAVTILLVVVAPLALICHALPQSEGLARLWWRALAGVLAIQVAQSLVLITALRVFFVSGGDASLGLSTSGGLIDVMVAACLLWVLVRIPSWVSRAVFAGSSHRPSMAVRLVRDAVIFKVARAGLAALA
jgi:hypothetical protein